MGDDAFANVSYGIGALGAIAATAPLLECTVWVGVSTTLTQRLLSGGFHCPK
ncbi:hypothetical protein [Vacuolonema iberomarrocanum]|uniref:hypothetical protein n=1 Tax=Vacuolonema iberomarrocanum TaxID=3454632 RepID=UPI0019E83C75|nr:hypothetical protein [filamentous cyanobacterium LEGE 07170]